jgi:hypothetical protein
MVSDQGIGFTCWPPAGLRRGVSVAPICSVPSLQPGLGADFAVPSEAADQAPKATENLQIQKKGYDTPK